MPRWLQRVATVLSALAGIALFVLLARSIDLRATWSALVHAHLGLIALGIAANAVATGLRGWRWQLLLHPVRPLPILRLVRYTFAAYAANNVLPARAGEALLAY